MNLLFEVSNVLSHDKISTSINENIELLIGQIVLNRVSGIAYDKLDLNKLHPEAAKYLKAQKEHNMIMCHSFLRNLEVLSHILSSINVDYALLKGAYLTPFLYKNGHRTSNDIDILVNSVDVSKTQELLLQNGFLQGYLSSKSEIIPSSRREIIEAKMNFGETVPFLKQFDDSMLEVDINFSLDFKPSQDMQIVSQMLSSTVYVENGPIRFKTLKFDDFLIHLCCHLYKEATTYNWVLSRRDLMLYKFSDINVFVYAHGVDNYFDTLVERIKYFRLEKECYYTLENASIIYPNLNKIEGFVEAKDAIRPPDLTFMTQIIWPREKKLFQHHLSFADWFFCPNRIAALEEIPYEAD